MVFSIARVFRCCGGDYSIKCNTLKNDGSYKSIYFIVFAI